MLFSIWIKDFWQHVCTRAEPLQNPRSTSSPVCYLFRIIAWLTVHTSVRIAAGPKYTYVRLFPLNRHSHPSCWKKTCWPEAIVLHLWNAALGFYLQYEYTLAKTGGVSSEYFMSGGQANTSNVMPAIKTCLDFLATVVVEPRTFTVSHCSHTITEILYSASTKMGNFPDCLPSFAAPRIQQLS